MLIAAVGTTAALLIWKSEKEQSTFDAAYAECSVVDSGDGAFSVKNDGDTDAYIRAVFTVAWKNSDGEIYGKKQPSYGDDYELLLDLENWFLGDDGFYYCKAPVKPDEETPALIVSMTAVEDDETETTDEALSDNSEKPVFPDDYTLTVDIAASAIQSEPKAAVTDYWNVRVNGVGMLGK